LAEFLEPVTSTTKRSCFFELKFESVLCISHPDSTCISTDNSVPKMTVRGTSTLIYYW